MKRFSLLTCVLFLALIAPSFAGRTLTEWQGDVSRVDSYGLRERGWQRQKHRQEIQSRLLKRNPPEVLLAPAAWLYQHGVSPSAGGATKSDFVSKLCSLFSWRRSGDHAMEAAPAPASTK